MDIWFYRPERLFLINIIFCFGVIIGLAIIYIDKIIYNNFNEDDKKLPFLALIITLLLLIIIKQQYNHYKATKGKIEGILNKIQDDFPEKIKLAFKNNKISFIENYQTNRLISEPTLNLIDTYQVLDRYALEMYSLNSSNTQVRVIYLSVLTGKINRKEISPLLKIFKEVSKN